MLRSPLPLLVPVIISSLFVKKRALGQSLSEKNREVQPCAAATWTFGELAIAKSSAKLAAGGCSLDAVEEGCKVVELDTMGQYFVGVGGYPNFKGVMELDAAIMDNKSNYGAVMALRNISTPISVARSVMEKCVHNILVGDGALEWAIANGFHQEEILTVEMEKAWLNRRMAAIGVSNSKEVKSHDTIGLICLDKEGKLACGTSTSGWAFKHPGRVGDAPLVGSGLYCDGEVGAAVATGDGEEIMRTCLSFLVVEYMRQGKSPKEACALGLARLMRFDANSRGNGWRDGDKLYVGVVAMDVAGNVGAASSISPQNPDSSDHDRPSFPVVCWRGDMDPQEHTIIEASVDGAAF